METIIQASSSEIDTASLLRDIYYREPQEKNWTVIVKDNAHEHRYHFYSEDEAGFAVSHSYWLRDVCLIHNTFAVITPHKLTRATDFHAIKADYNEFLSACPLKK